MVTRKFLGLLLLILSSGCGDNVYRSFDDQHPADVATVALEQQKPDKAINILEEALATDPTNYELISLLASAKAQKAGIDTMQLALNLATQSSETTSSDNEIVGLFGAMPEANSTRISLLSEAVTLLESIPAAEKKGGDQFKLGMFYTSLMTLRTKSIDGDGDGSLSAEEIANLDDETAVAILSDILEAESSLADYGAEDGTQDAAGQVSTIKSQIDSQPGDSDAEKLRNFLSNNS